MIDPALVSTVSHLWQATFGESAEGLQLKPFEASGNNRIFLACVGDRQAIAKWYFRGRPGSRDRLASEWQFLTYCEAAKVPGVAQPIACDSAENIALYGYLAGSKLSLDRIGTAEINGVAEFIRALNDPRHRAAAVLPVAQESCFSIAEHLALLDNRLARLIFVPQSPIDHRARTLADAMQAHWQGLKPRLVTQCQTAGLDIEAVLTPEERCISPSDIGFHNVLYQPSGELSFVDFEYGGWDDPAKLLCDFFLTPALPVSLTHWQAFCDSALSPWPDADRIMRRAQILLPLHALKWCCIMLNPFVSDLASAGHFANPDKAIDDKKQGQYHKAQAAFDLLTQ